MTDFMQDKDRADLETAALMVKEGRALRTRVRTRIRQRRYKHKKMAEGNP